MASELNIGDKVKLKSGGPLMTVSNLAGGHFLDPVRGVIRVGEGYIGCAWFAGDELRRSGFAVECVQLFEEAYHAP